jgi:tRNA pseudouridine38-40 synthase
MTTRYRATLAYDGTAYLGFQRQAGDATTIQGAVGAGRTDTGVHATGQVIAFDVDWKHPDDALLRAINANLPGDIALQDIRQHPGFHPRFDAQSRVYQYDIIQSECRQPLSRNRAWHIRAELDGTLMQQAAALLLGQHDFAAFGKPPQGENTIRLVMESVWSSDQARFGISWRYRIEANAFLQHMVRRIVGTLAEVGRGAITVDDFKDAFFSADLSRTGPTAPPQGLVLEQVNYP